MFTPKAWVLKFWLLIQLSSEQGVWGRDWIRWWTVFWWGSSMVALFGSGLGGQWATSWMEMSHPHPFLFFPASIRWAVSSATRSSHLRPTTMEHTDWIKIPTQWASQSFLLLCCFYQAFSQGDETFDWHSWKMQTTKRPMCILEKMCCHLAFPWLSDLRGTVPNLCFLFPHWHTAHSWTQKVPFTGAWVDELTSTHAAIAEYTLNVPWSQIYWPKTIWTTEQLK